MIYQHVARGADQLIANAIDAQVQGEQRKDDGDEDGSARDPGPGGLMARKINYSSWGAGGQTLHTGCDLGLSP
jgi:hypothetical protein